MTVDILICDEITGNLNYEMSQNIMQILNALNDEGTTIVFSTHDRRLMAEFPKRTIVIEEGVGFLCYLKGKVLLMRTVRLSM